MADIQAAPKRVRINWRHKGGKKPPNTVVVARPSKWGNPFRGGDPGIPDRATAVSAYTSLMIPYQTHGARPPQHGSKLADYLVSDTFIEEVKTELRGKDLACYCPLDAPCHADVLLEIANEEKNDE